MHRRARPIPKRRLAAAGLVAAAVLAHACGAAAGEPVVDKDRIAANRPRAEPGPPTVLTPAGGGAVQSRSAPASKPGKGPKKDGPQDTPRRDAPAPDGAAEVWIGPDQVAHLVQLPAEFVGVPDLRAKVRTTTPTCRIVFGWPRPPRPLVAIVCAARTPGPDLKITGFAPLRLSDTGGSHEIATDELISTRDLRLVGRGGPSAPARQRAIGLDWHSMIDGNWDPPAPAGGGSCTLDRPITLADLVEGEEPVERIHACDTALIAGPLPVAAKLEGCLDADAAHTGRCRIAPTASEGARIRFGGLFGDLDLRSGDVAVDPGDRTPRDGFAGGAEPTFALPGYGSIRYRATSARYCTATACCPDPAPMENGRPALSRFSPNAARCGDLGRLVDRLVIEADLAEAPEPIRPMVAARRSFEYLVDRPISAGPVGVADLLPARAYAVPLPEAAGVPRPRMQFYPSLDDCLKPDGGPPIVGSISVVADLEGTRANGRLAGTVDGRVPLYALHGRLFDATRPISSCAAAQATSEGDPLRAAGVFYRFPVTLAAEFSSRVLLVISPSGRFTRDGQAAAVAAALESWLASLKDRRDHLYFEVIEITDAGSTRRILESDQLASLATGGTGSLREILDGLAFVGTARRALGDLRQVVENHGGARIDRLLYIVDSTAEVFASAEIGPVYDLVGRKGIAFRVVSLTNCQGWQGIVPGNQNLVCTELNQNASSTRDVLRQELDRLVATKQNN